MSKTVFDKIKDIDPEFVKSFGELTEAALIKEKIFEMSRYATELGNAKSEDQDLKEKSEAHNEAKKTYSVPLDAIKLKMIFLHQLLRSKKGIATSAANITAELSKAL